MEQCPCGYPETKYETWIGHSPLCDVEVAERERRAARQAAGESVPRAGIVEGSFKACGWPEIYEEIRRRCGGDWSLLDTRCTVAIWDSLRRRRLTYNVVFVAHVA